MTRCCSPLRVVVASDVLGGLAAFMPAHASNISWIGPKSGFWDIAGNWNPGLPGGRRRCAARRVRHPVPQRLGDHSRSSRSAASSSTPTLHPRLTEAARFFSALGARTDEVIRGPLATDFTLSLDQPEKAHA